MHEHRPIEPLSQGDIERFNKFVPHKPETGCWLWTGSTKKTGYGQFSRGNYPWLAHRIAYVIAYGTLPLDGEIDHLCHNKACVRPDHLQFVSRSEHLRLSYRRDGQQNQHSRKTHCPAGHPYDVNNTYLNPRGYRKCRACRRAEWHRWKARKKALRSDRAADERK